MQLDLDIDAFSEAVSSTDWPPARCAALARRFFAQEWHEASQETLAALSALYRSAWLGQGESQRRDRVARVLGLFDWSCAHLGTRDEEARALRLYTWGMCHYSTNRSVGADVDNGEWLHFNSLDLFRLVCLLTTHPSDRADWAIQVSTALNFEDADAFEKVAAALIQRRAVLPEREWRYQTWGSGDGLDGRAFALVTAGMGVEERLRGATTWTHTRSAVNAAAHWLATQRKEPMPAFSAATLFPSFHGGSTSEAEAWAGFLTMAGRQDEALGFELVQTMLEALQFDVDAAEATLGLLADERVTVGDAANGKAVYRCGPWVLSRAIKGGRRGRLFSKRHLDLSAAARDFAKKTK